jgi:membrane-bound lytic murein transglycosylase A
VLGDAHATRPLRRFVMVQDIGGAIRGHGRGDIFWGTGPEAEWLAGHSRQTGRLLVLVAKKEFLRPDPATAKAP